MVINKFTIKKIDTELIFIGFIIISLFFLQKGYCQNIINNGNNIVVNNGAFVVIAGDYINLSSNGDGKIDLDGSILINGNWINNAPTTVFENIETVPDGNVVLRGSLPQYIRGSYPTHFENLSLVRSTKTLEVNNCEVNGIMTVDAILILNSNKIILDNSSPSAIHYVSKYILSETSPLDGYGEVQWNVGNSINTYSIPFGSGITISNDLNLALSTTSGGDPVTGNISFATYPSDCNNDVLPSGVNSLVHDAKNVSDRYWIIKPDYSVFKPDIDIIFKYNFEDVDICNQNIFPENLKAMRYNTDLMTWEDMSPAGIANKINRTVTVTGIPKSDFYSPWTLLTEEILPLTIFFPNAFTPDNDGINDCFGPSGIDLEKYSYSLYIFDRWGEMIYKTEDVNQFWNGKPDGSSELAPMGVYIWFAMLFDKNGQEFRYIGRVTLVR